MRNKPSHSSLSKTKQKIHGVKQKSNRPDKRLLVNHAKALQEAYKQTIKTPVSTLITCIVIAMTILLTTTLLVTLRSFKQVTDYINSSNQVTIYLKSTSSETEINNWIAQLKLDPKVKGATYMSSSQALEDLSKQADYRDILSNIEQNPLPPVITLKLNTNDQSQVKVFEEQLKNSPLVSSVNLDFDWLQRLSTLITLGNRLSYALTVIFGLGVLFIISHSIQGATQQNQQEMYLLQLIGAPLPYIRRPFIYLGTLLGLGAGLITLLLLVLLFLPLKASLVEFLDAYNLAQLHIFTNAKIFISIVVISTFLGWIGAWMAFYRYTRLL